MQLFDLVHSLVGNGVSAVAVDFPADQHFNDIFTPAGFLNEILRSIGTLGSFGSS